jgi:hypothetical protein
VGEEGRGEGRGLVWRLKEGGVEKAG